MYAALLFAVLTGPRLQAPRPTLEIRIHVGNGRESSVIRSELNCDHEWFLSKRLRIENAYRLMLVDDLFKSRPTYQIGKGDARHDFAPGAFAASGSFMATLESVAAIDAWERANPWMGGWSGWGADTELSDYQLARYAEHRRSCPAEFPPRPAPQVPPPDDSIPDVLPSPDVPPPAPPPPLPPPDVP